MGFIQVDPQSIKLDSISPSMAMGGVPPVVSDTQPPPQGPGNPQGGGFIEVDPKDIQLDTPPDTRSIAERFAKGQPGQSYEIGDIAKGAWQGVKQLGSYVANNPIEAIQRATTATDSAVKDIANNPGDALRSAASGVVRSTPQAVDFGGALVAKGINYADQKLNGAPNVPFSEYANQAPLNSATTAVLGPEYQPQTPGGEAVKFGAGLVSPLGYVKGAKAAIGAAKMAGNGIAATGSVIGNAAQTVGTAAKTAYTGRTAQELLQDIVQKTGKTPEELKAALEAGKISTIADIGGDSVQGLTRAVAKTGIGKDIIADALEGRSQDAVKRVSDELSKNVSHVDTYFGNLDDVASARQKIAAPLYQDAYKANPSVQSKQVDRILDTPAGRSALKSAVSKMQNDRSLVGIPDAELGEQARLAGIKAEGGVAPGLNLRTLDYVKRSLDDQIGEAQRAGQRDNVRILTGLKGDLVKSLDEADVTAKAGPNSLKPEGGAYKQARQVFSDHSKLIEAQEAGRDFASQTPEQLRMALKDMGPDQKEAFRIGVREGLQNTVNKTADGADPAKRIFGNTQKRAQLQEVFDNPENFKAFETRMNEEIQAAGTKQRVLGGSRTDYNIAADDELGQMVASLPSKGVTRTALDAGINKAVDFVTKRYYGINDANAKVIANALVNREAGIKALDDLIKSSSGPTQQAATAAKSVIKQAMQAPNPASTPTGNLITRTPMRDAPNPKDKPLRIDIGRKRGSK